MKRILFKNSPFLVVCSVFLFLPRCGAQRALSGIWQQVPLEEFEGFSSESSPLYELHMGQYGERISGLLVRYQAPIDRSLSAFDIQDQCDCAFMTQGTINPKIAFSLLDSDEAYVLSNPSPCRIEHSTCQRLFNLEEDPEFPEELIGSTWCLDRKEETLRSLRFRRIVGVPLNQCIPSNQ